MLHGRYAGSAVRMDEGEVEEGLEWLEDRFHVIRYEDDELPSVDWVLDLARAAVLRCCPALVLSWFASASSICFETCLFLLSMLDDMALVWSYSHRPRELTPCANYWKLAMLFWHAGDWGTAFSRSKSGDCVQVRHPGPCDRPLQ